MSRFTTWAGLKNTSLARCRMDPLPSVRTVKPSGTGLLRWEDGREPAAERQSRRRHERRRLAVWAAGAEAPAGLHACNWKHAAAMQGAARPAAHLLPS